jgi:hypothetical protein
VCSPNAVVYIANGEVNRVIGLLTGCDRDGRLVGTEDDGDEHGSVRCRVH